MSINEKLVEALTLKSIGDITKVADFRTEVEGINDRELDNINFTLASCGAATTQHYSTRYFGIYFITKNL